MYVYIDYINLFMNILIDIKSLIRFIITILINGMRDGIHGDPFCV